MPANRQLSAVLFTDIEGYTALVQQDEQQGLSIRNRHREVVQKGHEEFNGQIIQYYGDGTLSIFQSVIDAANCAIAMQKIFCLSPVVPVRMGLHLGDIIFEDGQVFGNGVNLASRIESLGVAGSVLISDKVNDELKNHPNFKTVSMGIYQLKNVQEEVEVFAIADEGLKMPVPRSLEGKTRREEIHALTQGKKNAFWRLDAKDSKQTYSCVNQTKDKNLAYCLYNCFDVFIFLTLLLSCAAGKRTGG